jgi:hypothetical protein
MARVVVKIIAARGAAQLRRPGLLERQLKHGDAVVFLFYRRPGALHQRGFEPGTALAHAIGSTLAGTLVVGSRE